MKSKLFLHVGTHKTGTTALQRYMSDNRAALQRDSVLYPHAGRAADLNSSWGHHQLAAALRDNADFTCWSDLAREIKDFPRVVVSSEEFSLIAAPRLYGKVTELLRDRDVFPICYLRRQDELLESIYRYHVLALGETRPIMEFASRVNGRLAFLRLTEALSAAFGRERLILRIYHKEEIKSDVIGDFLSCIGLEKPSPDYKRPPSVVNPGLTRHGLDLMREANREYADEPQSLRRVRRRIIAAHQAEPFSSHGILTDDERRDLLSRYAAMNEKIAREYFGRPRLFS